MHGLVIGISNEDYLARSEMYIHARRSANDLKMLQEWFETNRIRETGIVENVQKQPASPERDEMLEICKGNIEEFSMMIQLVASIIEREKN